MPQARPPSRFQREVYDGDALGLKHLDQFGWTSVPAAGDLGLGPHTHPNAYEICLITAGHVTWWAGNRAWSLNPGDLYITRPDEPHGGADGVLQPCSIYWVQVRLRPRLAFPNLAPAQAKRITDAFARLKLRSFPAQPALVHSFTALHHEFRDLPDHASASAPAALQSLLINVLRDHDHARDADLAAHQPTPVIQRAIDLIDANLGQPMRIHTLARRVGLGVSRLHERFARETGFSPADYRTHLRIRRAKQRLPNTDQSITTLALELGFSSSQHFAAVFRKLVGLTPTQFRARPNSAPPDQP